MLHELGLIDEARWARFNQKWKISNRNANAYAAFGCIPRSEYLEEANKVLGSPLVLEANGEDLLRRPENNLRYFNFFNAIQTGNGRQRSRRDKWK